MNLDELRAMKEKTDSIVATLQNDRKVLIESKKKVQEDNAKDLRTFLESLREYAELLPANVSYVESVDIFPLFSRFDKHRYMGFWKDDTKLNVYDGKFQLLCANGDEEYCIYINKDSAWLEIPKGHHTYSSIYLEDFKVFLLDHKEEVRAYVEEGLKRALDKYVAENKERNDSLYADIERLNREE